MGRFIDRERELKTLEEQYALQSASFVVIYGRRRVGKTTLISEFIKGKNALYFLAREETERLSMRRFAEALGEYTGQEYLKNANFTSWDDLFKVFRNHKQEGRKILVIDELPYIVSSNAAFPSILQGFWDQEFMNDNLMLILCGSLVNMMEKYALSYSSPLYGRRTAQIKLRQIDFMHYNKFYENMPYKNLIEHYAVTGGVPKYIELFDGRKKLFDEIERNILSPDGLLFEEPEFLLRNEVSEIGSYFSVIKSVAAGNRKLSKIAADINIRQTSLPKYLKTLMDLDILDREVPVTESNPENSKMSLYSIRDNYIRFWFRFIYPEKARIELGQTKFVREKIEADFVVSHVAYIYENICRSEMWELNKLGKLRFNKIGRWWNNNEEIDIAALDTEGNELVFAECKFRSQKMDTDVYFDLLRKKEQVLWKKENRNEKFVLFSISGFSEQLEKLASESKGTVLLFSAPAER